ncbi:heterokaryon incompatibility protein-domain-containing protein [Chaetomium tenue]|uniref:Heterokaryon incompatibility protein-domain-containing protein n=1 Tax=Chaetomium tenue TaxID=1854479 RepID=A0ACB7P5D7_9PEZI|nr:heterokaryon incompatibility protein-domain-containing protein [Chaetomium globosum]
MKGAALCKLCAGLDIQAAVERIVSQDESQNNDSLTISSPWHSTLASVDISSSSCALCAIIMKGWQASREVVVEQAIQDAMFDPANPPPGLNDPVNRIPAYRDTEGITVEVVRRARRVRDGRGNAFSLFLRVKCGPATAASFDVVDRVVAELRIARTGGGSVALGAAGAVLAKVVRHTDLLVPEDPLSQESLDVARGWLETCVNSHGADCSPSGAEKWMPTRLLEVVPQSNKIYLRESTTLDSTGDARYVALSHCWGQGGTPFTTTQQTLPHRMSGIAIDNLPQTFQDSVTLTKELGLRYLWIDSLCIIQDDAADWAKEAAQMAHVYRNAHLVLNAANSDSDSKGFLQPRHTPDTVPLPPPPPPNTLNSPSPFTSTPLNLNPNPYPLASPNLNLNLKFHLQLLPPPTRRPLNPTTTTTTTTRQDRALAHEPISTRAWCLQEHILPVRALQYGRRQMFWGCELMRAGEGGDVVPLGQAQALGGGQLKRLCVSGNIDVSVFARGADRDPGKEAVVAVNWAGWYRMLEDYSARRITKHTDRLPALAGLALAVGRETSGGAGGEDYLAGIWRTGLLEGLLWCKAQAGQVLVATPEYVAPSWSWAAVVGAVQFPLYEWYTRRAHWKARMADFEALAEYCSHAMVKKDRDPYGRLNGGSLTLRAPLLRVVSVWPRPDRPPELRSLFGHAPDRSEVTEVVVQMKLGSGSVWVEGGFEDQGAVADATKLIVVFLCRLPHVLEEGFVEQRFGLILEPVGGSEQYRRVGFIDGVVLKRSVLGVFRGHGMFSIVGYPRPFEKDDVYESVRDNNLAEDPLRLDKTEVTMC